MTTQSTPQTLYKFRDWKDDNHQRTLTGGEFYFAAANTLNDPFDTIVPIRFDHGSHDVYLERCIKHLRRLGCRHNDEFIRKTAEDQLRIRNPKSEETLKEQQEFTLRYVNNNFGICSFSTRNDSILMWSHYADNHRGFCVGLDTDPLESVFQKVTISGPVLELHPVNYEIKFPFLDGLLDENGEAFRKKLITKSKEWEYENEWRGLLVSYPSKEQLSAGELERVVSVPLEVITEVILGAEMPDEQKDDIVNLARATLPQTHLYEARKREDAFKIEFRRI